MKFQIPKNLRVRTLENYSSPEEVVREPQRPSQILKDLKTSLTQTIWPVSERSSRIINIFALLRKISPEIELNQGKVKPRKRSTDF